MLEAKERGDNAAALVKVMPCPSIVLQRSTSSMTFAIYFSSNCVWSLRTMTNFMFGVVVALVLEL